jgi:hypothetical protein
MIAQSADILGQMGVPGENQVVFKALVRIVSEQKFSLGTRSIAAESLGHLNYAGGDKANPVQATAALGQLAIDSCLAETKLPSDADAEVPENYRRLVQRLSSVQLAAKGIASLAQEPAQKTFLDELQKNVEQLTKSLESTQNEGKDMTPSIDETRGKLETWLKNKPAS